MNWRASLAMYARPELDADHSALWSAMRENLADQGIKAPAHLDPDGVGYDFWEAPDMLFSQTCGYPFRTRLKGKVALVGTPDYGLQGCPPGYYHSVIVACRSSVFAHGADLNGALFAFNEGDSQSGYYGPKRYFADMGISVATGEQTGSHLASARAVATGVADLAAIDAVTWHNLVAFEPFTSELAVLAKTKPVPGLPIITARADLVPRLQAALIYALESEPRAAKALGIVGFCEFDTQIYSETNF